MQYLVLPGPFVAKLRELRLNLFSPVASTLIHQIYTSRSACLHTFKQCDGVRIIEITLHLFPEIRHCRERIVAQHCPHGICIRSCEKYILSVLKRQDAIILKEHYRLCGDIISRLALIRGVEFYILSAIQIRILIKETSTELITKHILNCPFQSLRLYKSFIDGLLKILIVGSEWEVNIITAINSRSSLMQSILNIWNLVDGSIVTYYHSVKSHITTKDILKDLTVAHTFCAVYLMISRHNSLAASKTNHCLMRQEYLLHHLLLIGITTSAIAKIVLRTSTNTLLQITLL